MADSAMPDRASWVPAQIYKRPYLGILVVLTLIAFQMVGHSFTMILREYLEPSSIFYLDMVIGALGFVLVWKGFGKDEVTASCFGALGGGLIWYGWYESTFALVAGPMLIDTVMYNGNPYYGGGIQILEASGPFIVPILMLLALNKDTRCRFFLWFQRNFRLKPETPTVGYRRQYSRITALEYIFITWFIYVVDLLLLDPRILGPESMLAVVLFAAYVAWAGYLFFYKIPQQSGVGPTIRYGMAVGIVVWMIPETLAATRIMLELWLRPFEFPILMSLITLFMLVSGYALLNSPDRGALPKKRKQRTVEEATSAN